MRSGFRLIFGQILWSTSGKERKFFDGMIIQGWAVRCFHTSSLFGSLRHGREGLKLSTHHEWVNVEDKQKWSDESHPESLMNRNVKMVNVRHWALLLRLTGKYRSVGGVGSWLEDSETGSKKPVDLASALHSVLSQGTKEGSWRVSAGRGRRGAQVKVGSLGGRRWGAALRRQVLGTWGGGWRVGVWVWVEVHVVVVFAMAAVGCGLPAARWWC